jgi:putative ABC transport system permease protein
VLLHYAWKGFWRRRTRTILAVLGIALSIALLAAVVTITRAVEQAVASSLSAAGADMVIQKQIEYCPFRVVKLPKDLAGIDTGVVEKLRGTPGVKEVSGVLELWAFYFADEKAPVSLPFPKKKTEATKKEADVSSDSQGLPIIDGKALQPTVVAGIDPNKKTIGPVRVATRTEGEDEEGCCAVARGRYLAPDDHYEVMITEEFAKKHDYDLGDKIHIGPKKLFEVVAVLDISGAARIAGAQAFIPLATAQELLGQGDVVDTIFVALNSKRDAEAVTNVARGLIGEGASITTEANVEAGTAALASVTRNSLLAVSGLVLVFALLLLVYNALDNVAHRVGEVGILKALGWRNADVGRLFVAEAAYAGIIGGLLGSALGSFAGGMYGKLADLKLPETLNNFPECADTAPQLALHLSTNPSVEVFLLGLASALVIGTIAGLAASRRAARLNPVDALRRL